MAWRYIAERIRTRTLLDTDLDLVPDGPPTRELSGPGSLSGHVPWREGPTVAPDGQPIIDDWSTAIYAEENGEIVWGGLVTDTQPDGDKLQVSCSGFVSYPHGQPYLSKMGGSGLDVFDIVRHLWTHLQSFPAGNLNMVVDSVKSPVKVGTVAEPWGLVWWDSQDVGQVIDDLARSSPFDYIERHAWNAGRTRIDHFLDLGFPRLGGRREDLRFVVGENVTEMPPLDRTADYYANELFGVGKGEGSQSTKASVAVDDRLRVRRSAVYENKGQTVTPLTANLRRQLSQRRQEWQVSSLVVREHPNAPLGSWNIGDDIPVTVEHQPWVSQRVIWHRVISDQIDTTAGVATLALIRSDAWTMG